MDLKNFTKKILSISNDMNEIEKVIICTFIKQGGYNYSKSRFFIEYFSEIDNNLMEQAMNYCVRKKLNLDLNALIEVFELLIPDNEKKINGMVYTPQKIKDYIIESLLDNSNMMTICDPACGCGSFLLSAAEYLHNKHGLSFKNIFGKIIYGVDIIPHNIEKASVLLRVLALINGEIYDDSFNLKVGDSLSLNWNSEFKSIMNKGGFDYIIGNPPYVRVKNIQEEVKQQLNNWGTANNGNVDLYIPFYELGLKLLNMRGKLGYISVNTFLKSLNGRGLRNYLKEFGYETKILDFKDAQIFKNVTSYTCIVLIDKEKPNKDVYYSSCNGSKLLNECNFIKLSYNDFIYNKPWRLFSSNVKANIEKIENIGFKLGDYKIRNGLATLKNDIYFFKPISEDDNYYIREYNGKTYKIEKSICIDVVKPNVIKNEKELYEMMEKGIFPYTNNNGILQVISKYKLKTEFPGTYLFLNDVKGILEKRDKGKGNYSEWYAYGRTQGMNNFGKKLLIPYMSKEPISVICEKEDVLFYCGYAIFIDSLNEMKFIKRIIESDVFWYYMKHTSKPYANGYLSIAKNYIKEFGIPKLTEYQKLELINLNDKTEINSYVKKIYKIPTLT